MACPREERERLEHLMIGPYGVLAENTRGRAVPEEECRLRTCFQRDVDRITHSKSFRRLKHKTQVFLQPEGDHYRTRLTHTLEVTRLARTVARALRLNEDLAEAIALGHDLGHTPFGHAGERALNKIYEGGFKHYEQSLRVADILERDGQGLNLCFETRMGILNHTHGAPDDTREATAVRLCDRIAYINHDLDDSIRAGLLTDAQVPEIIRLNCGERNSERIDAFMQDLVDNSADGVLKMSPGCRRPSTSSTASCIPTSTPTPSPRARRTRSRASSAACTTTTFPIPRSCRRTSGPSLSGTGAAAPPATTYPA